MWEYLEIPYSIGLVSRDSSSFNQLLLTDKVSLITYSNVVNKTTTKKKKYSPSTLMVLGEISLCYYLALASFAALRSQYMRYLDTMVGSIASILPTLSPATTIR